MTGVGLDGLGAICGWLNSFRMVVKSEPRAVATKSRPWRILGTGPASRLFLNIREDKGYAYSVGSSFNAGKYRGTFTAQSPVRTEVTEGAMREFMNEFKRIRDEQVTPTELENAKRAIVGSFALALENPNSRL
jgi:zinc protease